MPEDLSLILNDSSLFSATPDITTKEILKRYGDRARVGPSPSYGPPGLNHSSTDPIISGGNSSPPPSTHHSTPKSRDGRSSAPIVTRVDTDPEQANAWQNESSVRHVGGNALTDPAISPSTMAPPVQPYALGSAANLSAESADRSANGAANSQTAHSSPSRHSYHRNSGYDKPRPMGVT